MTFVMYALLLVGGAVLIQAVGGQSLTGLLVTLRQQRQRRQTEGRNPADGGMPPLPTLPLAQVVGATLGAGAVVLTLALTLRLQGWLLLLLLPALVLMPLLLVAVLEARVARRLDMQVVDVATQVASAMQSGVPLLQAVQRVAASVPEPLATTWGWLVGQTGAPVVGRDGSTRYLTLAQVARAVAAHTPHRLLMLLLDHLAAASDLAQADARDRMQAAADALHGSRLRMAEVRAKLTHARVSGLMVLGIGAGMGLFLALSMPERFSAAFAGPLAPFMIALLGVLYGLPVAGILLLSRVPALDI